MFVKQETDQRCRHHQDSPNLDQRVFYTIS
uniref:Uncharacterized protein n=1 Tax=Setaria italica TaxID=4555 RepID=K4ANU1_SETIT